MVRRGWRNESGRHSLAARGMRTKYPRKSAIQSVPSLKYDIKDNLRIIAEYKGLSEVTTNKFIEYYIARGFPNDPSYMGVWADRFLNQKEFWKSDSQGQRLLLKMYGKESDFYIHMNLLYGSENNLNALREGYKWKTTGEIIEPLREDEIEILKAEWREKNT